MFKQCKICGLQASGVIYKPPMKFYMLLGVSHPSWGEVESHNSLNSLPNLKIHCLALHTKCCDLFVTGQLVAAVEKSSLVCGFSIQII